MIVGIFNFFQSFKTLNKEQRQFFEKNIIDENFIPHPEKSDKSFFEKVKDMFS